VLFQDDDTQSKHSYPYKLSALVYTNATTRKLEIFTSTSDRVYWIVS